MLNKFIAVFLGGGLGSVARYLLSVYIKNESHTFPWHTFAVNILASLILGIVAAYFYEKTNHIGFAIFAIGFCGGFSTFSTFASESLNLFNQQQYMICALYISLSVAISMLALFGGFELVKSLK